jgi:hypothetical protein
MTSAEKIRDLILPALQRNEASPSLASDYAQLCKEVNRRLLQIEEVLDRGDYIQALQMAEIHPPVMDEADALCFFGYERWNSLCESAHVTVAPDIRSQAILKLNNIYGKGLATSDPIYKELRDAILGRNDEKALEIAKIIESLAPNDANIKLERDRLEKKVLDKQLILLRRLLEEKNNDQVLKSLALIEQRGNSLIDDIPEVKSARQIKFEFEKNSALGTAKDLIQKLTVLQNVNDWKEMVDFVARIESLRSRYNIQLSLAEQSELENSKLYSDKKREEAVKLSDFRSAERQFILCLDDLSSRTQAKDALSIAQCRDFLTSLNKSWQLIESFSMPVDKARVEEAARLVEMLRNDIERLQKSRALKMVSLAAAALVLIGVSGWWIVIQYRAADMTNEIQLSVKTQSIGSVKKLIADADRSNLPHYSSKLTAKVEEARKWLEATEKECTSSSDALMDLLKRSSMYEAEDPIKLDEEFNVLISRLKKLPDEQQKLVEPDVLKLQKLYSDHLAILGESFDEKIQSETDDFNRAIENLNRSNLNLDEYKDTILKAKQIISTWDKQIRSPIKDLPVSASLKAKAEADEERINKLSETVQSIDTALLSMSKSSKPDQYREALKTLKGVDLPNCKLIQEAKIAWNAEATPESLLPELLFHGNLGAYQAVKQGGQAKLLKPETILPPELNAFSLVLNDEITSGAKTYTLEGGNPQRRIYSVLDIKSNIDDGDLSVFTGKTYDPLIDSASVPSFTLRTYRANGTGKEKAKKISEGTECNASKIYKDLGLSDFVSETMQVHRSALELLDRMTQSAAKDPLYSAFVVQQINEMTKARPYAWGIQYSPSAIELLNQIDQIIRVHCGSLPQGSWMAPSFEKLLKELQPFFAKSTHFNAEAQLNKLLVGTIIDTSGFQYAGYVGEDGKPILKEIFPPASDLYGITGEADKRIASRVYQLKNADKSEYESTSKPIVFTPLFYVEKGRKNVLDASIHILRLEQFQNELSLPPLFADLLNTKTKQP